ncbi:unnamed protein product, partial [marine sediment metagenome]
AQLPPDPFSTTGDEKPDGDSAEAAEAAEAGGVRRVYDDDAGLIMPHELEPGDRVRHRRFGRGVV